MMRTSTPYVLNAYAGAHVVDDDPLVYMNDEAIYPASPATDAPVSKVVPVVTEERGEDVMGEEDDEEAPVGRAAVSGTEADESNAEMNEDRPADASAGEDGDEDNDVCDDVKVDASDGETGVSDDEVGTSDDEAAASDASDASDGKVEASDSEEEDNNGGDGRDKVGDADVKHEEEEEGDADDGDSDDLGVVDNTVRDWVGDQPPVEGTDDQARSGSVGGHEDADRRQVDAEDREARWVDDSVGDDWVNTHVLTQAHEADAMDGNATGDRAMGDKFAAGIHRRDAMSQDTPVLPHLTSVNGAHRGSATRAAATLLAPLRSPTHPPADSGMQQGGHVMPRTAGASPHLPVGTSLPMDAPGHPGRYPVPSRSVANPPNVGAPGYPSRYAVPPLRVVHSPSMGASGHHGRYASPPFRVAPPPLEHTAAPRARYTVLPLPPAPPSPAGAPVNNGIHILPQLPLETPPIEDSPWRRGHYAMPPLRVVSPVSLETPGHQGGYTVPPLPIAPPLPMGVSGYHGRHAVPPQPVAIPATGDAPGHQRHHAGPPHCAVPPPPMGAPGLRGHYAAPRPGDGTSAEQAPARRGSSATPQPRMGTGAGRPPTRAARFRRASAEGSWRGPSVGAASLDRANLGTTVPGARRAERPCFPGASECNQEGPAVPGATQLSQSGGLLNASESDVTAAGLYSARGTPVGDQAGRPARKRVQVADAQVDDEVVENLTAEVSGDEEPAAGAVATNPRNGVYELSERTRKNIATLLRALFVVRTSSDKSMMAFLGVAHYLMSFSFLVGISSADARCDFFDELSIAFELPVAMKFFMEDAFGCGPGGLHAGGRTISEKHVFGQPSGFRDDILRRNINPENAALQWLSRRLCLRKNIDIQLGARSVGGGLTAVDREIIASSVAHADVRSALRERGCTVKYAGDGGVHNTPLALHFRWDAKSTWIPGDLEAGLVADMQQHLIRRMPVLYADRDPTKVARAARAKAAAQPRPEKRKPNGNQLVGAARKKKGKGQQISSPPAPDAGTCHSCGQVRAGHPPSTPQTITADLEQWSADVGRCAALPRGGHVLAFSLPMHMDTGPGGRLHVAARMTKTSTGAGPPYRYTVVVERSSSAPQQMQPVDVAAFVDTGGRTTPASALSHDILQAVGSYLVQRRRPSRAPPRGVAGPSSVGGGQAAGVVHLHVRSVPRHVPLLHTFELVSQFELSCAAELVQRIPGRVIMFCEGIVPLPVHGTFTL